MKKVKFLVLFLILLLPLATADINVDKFSSNVYNYGSKLLISGNIKQTTDVRARADFTLTCNNATGMKIVSLMLNLKANEPNSFSQLTTIPNNAAGSCNLKVDLLDTSEKLLETRENYAFEISNDLKGTFENQYQTYQLGDVLNIRGIITREDNTPVDGVAVIKFKQGENIVLTDTIEIIKGNVDYKKTLNLLPAGAYNIDITVTDNFGNTHGFIDAAVFQVNNDITINAGLDKTTYTPGDILKLTGIVSTTLKKELKNVEVEYKVESEKQTAILLTTTEGLNYNYKIPGNIKSGKHTINVKATDDEGNYGERILNFEVKAIPTSLVLTLDNPNINPGENVGVTANLLDQANDAIDGSITLNIIDNKNKIVSSKVIKSNTKGEFSIPQGTLPNNWKIKAEGFGLINEIPITIKEQQKLDVKLQGEKLLINNTGNVPYNGLFEVIGNTEKTGKTIKLKTGKSTELELSSLLKAGKYNIEIPSTGDKFTDVAVTKPLGFFSKLTGGVTANVSTGKRPYVLYSSLLVVLFALIYMIFRKNGENKTRKASKDQSDYELGQKKLDELRAKGIRKDKPAEYGKANKDDIEDFRKRMGKMFNDDNKQKDLNNYFDNQKKVHRPENNRNNEKPKEGGGMFNMFN
ncbi:hypothetical protein J4476_06020 [Candidatus Woesearchaeota archaeon]|nr:hypothetical protein [Candidatus Woesearchaeota archaeon]